MRKTSDFQLALQKGKIELAKEWLNYIVENKENFPQYEVIWDSWLTDRQKEIELYQQLKNLGLLQEMKHRTKEEAQDELERKFGFRDTKGFRFAIEQGDINTAKNWLNYIVENKLKFPQYLATWESWLSDRKQELTESEK